MILKMSRCSVDTLKPCPDRAGFFIALALEEFGYIDEIKNWLGSKKIIIIGSLSAIVWSIDLISIL